MTKPQQINYNGEILPANTAIFGTNNRAFRYGDGFFESLRIINGKIPLFGLHFRRLLKGFAHLKLNIADNFTEEYCKMLLLNFAAKNEIEQNGRIRLSFFRTGGGFYLPENNNAEYVIEGIAMAHNGFDINEKGLHVDIYTEAEKHFSPFSAIKTNNALLYIMAAIYRETHKLDDCLLINSQNRLIESIESNLFMVKNNALYTPPVTEGCVAGVMREFIIHLAEKENIPLSERPVNPDELLEADEAFLCNAIYGIKWIKSYKSKTYANNISQKLGKKINVALIQS